MMTTVARSVIWYQLVFWKGRADSQIAHGDRKP